MKQSPRNTSLGLRADQTYLFADETKRSQSHAVLVRGFYHPHARVFVECQPVSCVPENSGALKDVEQVENWQSV